MKQLDALKSLKEIGYCDERIIGVFGTEVCRSRIYFVKHFKNLINCIKNNVVITIKDDKLYISKVKINSKFVKLLYVFNLNSIRASIEEELTTKYIIIDNKGKKYEYSFMFQKEEVKPLLREINSLKYRESV